MSNQANIFINSRSDFLVIFRNPDMHIGGALSCTLLVITSTMLVDKLPNMFVMVDISHGELVVN
jgi:hypothetical protein